MCCPLSSNWPRLRVTEAVCPAAQQRPRLHQRDRVAPQDQLGRGGEAGVTGAQHHDVLRRRRTRLGPLFLPLGPQNQARLGQLAQLHRVRHHVEPAPFDLVEQSLVHGAHDFRRDELRPVGRHHQSPRFREIMPRPVMLEAEQLPHPLRPAPLHDLRLGYAERLQLVERQVNSPEGCIFLHVAQDVRQLEGHSQRNRVIARARVAAAEDVDAHQADRARHPVAILVQQGKFWIARDRLVHLHAVQDFLQRRRRNQVGTDDLCEFLAQRRARFIHVGAPDLLAPFPQLTRLLIDRKLGRVGHIIHHAAKGVENRHGPAFRGRQRREGKREIRSARLRDRLAARQVGHGLGRGRRRTHEKSARRKSSAMSVFRIFGRCDNVS